MKRGLIEWDRSELPASTLEERQARCRSLLTQKGLDGLILYTDLWRSGQVRYLSNFIPYFNHAVLLLPREGESVLVTGLSARVYPWIKESSAITTIASGAPLGGEAASQVKRLGWRRIGIGELERFPYGVLNELRTSLPDSTLVDATELLDNARRAAGAADLSLYRKAREIAAAALAEVAAGLPGKSGWQAAALLERAIRRRGATDTVILLAPGADARWPAYPGNETMTPNGFAVISVEYKGHWVEIGRPLAGGGPQGRALRDTYTRWAETLQTDRPLTAPANFAVMASAGHRSFPFTPVETLGGLPDGTVVALHLSSASDGTRSWWGESLVIDADRVRSLAPDN
jgi:hypothetical protein